MTRTEGMVQIVLAVGFALSLAGCAAQTALTPRHVTKTVVTAGDWTDMENEPMDPTIPPFDPRFGAGPADQIKSRFRGIDRKVAKIGVVGGSVSNEGTVDALAGSLPTDDDMLSHNPAITKDAHSDRVMEERKTVAVKGWVYAIKYEDDQDWHLIVGTDPDASGNVTYFNCEVSGLPAPGASTYNALLKVRQSLADILDNDLPGPGAYSTYEPFPVTIQGSLFFDVDHAAGVVGPSGMRPKTAWEIHPITKIAWAE